MKRGGEKAEEQKEISEDKCTSNVTVEVSAFK
jgi:hypothetical protein